MSDSVRNPPGECGAHGLAPMLHVVDVDRAVRFYELLGFVPGAPLRDPAGRSFYCAMRAEDSHVMFTRASGPVNSAEQAVLLYMYSVDVGTLRRHLLAHGVRDGGRYGGGSRAACPEGVVFEPAFPFYMQKGEIRIEDPEGYCILVGQLE